MPGRPPTSVSSTIVTPFRSPSASYCRHWTQPSIKRGFEAPSSMGAFDCFLKSEENMSLFNRPRAPIACRTRTRDGYNSRGCSVTFFLSPSATNNILGTLPDPGAHCSVLSKLSTTHCAVPLPLAKKASLHNIPQQNLCVHTFRLFSSPSRHTKQRTHAHIQNLAPHRSALIFDSSHLRSPHLLFCR